MFNSQTSALPNNAVVGLQKLRDYPLNSPHAKARLIALTLMADGRLDGQELDDLSRRSTFAKLGLTREDFFQVLYDFCADISTTPNRDDNYLITPHILDSLFAEITEPAERKALLRVIFDVIRSDGRLALGEVRLFWNAVEAWNLVPASNKGALRSKKLRRKHATPAFSVV